jgi:GNAT superfamily N-acetyltransferase
MFPPEEWDKLVAEHAPPNVLLVAVNELDEIAGYTAVHPKEGELYLLFVHPEHAGRGVGRTLLAAADEAMRAVGCREAFLYTHEQNKRRWRFTKRPDIGAMARFANLTFEASTCASPD